MRDLAQIKEQIVESYSRTFDKDMAYIKVGLTPEEIEILEKDEDFQNRLYIHKINECEVLIERLRKFKDSEDDKIALKATIELGQNIYPEFFRSNKNKLIDINVNNTNTKEEDAIIEDQYGEILENKNAFKK